jgi:hypothetical protein
MGVGGDDGDEQGAGLDLLADHGIPGVATPKLALVEPHLDAGGAQRRADALCGIGVFRRIAEKDGPLATPDSRVATKPRVIRQGAMSRVSF